MCQNSKRQSFRSLRSEKKKRRKSTENKTKQKTNNNKIEKEEEQHELRLLLISDHLVVQVPVLMKFIAVI